MLPRGVLVLFFAALLPAATPRRILAGGEAARPIAEPPRENASYVPDDDEGMRKTRKAVEAAVLARDWPTAIRGLQKLAEGPLEAVALVSEGRVYEGAAVVAHHEVLRLGSSALAAYRQEFGARAHDALVAAAAARDEDRLAAIVERWLPTDEARTAALLLADLASERGDSDAALGWLERIEDLEDVAHDDLAGEVATWREARVAREAVAYASDRDAVERVRAWRARPTGPLPAANDLRRPRPPDGWPTSGGGASRSIVTSPLGTSLTFRWIAPLHEMPAAAGARFEPAGPERRPSPWLPPRAVVSGSKAYASDGRFLHSFDLEGGKRAAFPVALVPGAVPDDASSDRGVEARKRFGLLEGHALTAYGPWVWCAVPAERGDPAADPSTSDDDPNASEPDPLGGNAPPKAAPPRARRGDRIVAVQYDGDAGRVVWEAGGGIEGSGLPSRLNLFGAPLLYHGTLYSAGVREATSSKDRAEAFLVALDPATGAVRWTTTLAAGEPIRSRRHDELVPSSCAAERGRIVVVTNLGVAAAVDARSGRALWSCRYDRARPDGSDTRQRLDGEDTEAGERRTSFSNEPPLLSGGHCFLAPTDSRTILALTDRPRGRSRALSLWRVGRTEAFRNLAVEQLVGTTNEIDGKTPLLVVAGQGYPTPGEIQTCVAALDARTGTLVWDRALPTGGLQEPFGRAAMTATEVFVSTLDGIAAYRLSDGTELPFLGRGSIPTERRSLLREDERPWGNLVPVAGRGLLTVNENEVAWWGMR